MSVQTTLPFQTFRDELIQGENFTVDTQTRVNATLNDVNYDCDRVGFNRSYADLRA